VLSSEQHTAVDCAIFTEANSEWWPSVLAMQNNNNNRVEPNPTSSDTSSWVCDDVVKL